MTASCCSRGRISSFCVPEFVGLFPWSATKLRGLMEVQDVLHGLPINVLFCTFSFRFSANLYPELNPPSGVLHAPLYPLLALLCAFPTSEAYCYVLVPSHQRRHQVTVGGVHSSADDSHTLQGGGSGGAIR